MSAPIPVIATSLDTCVDCVGYLVATAITDKRDCITYQHSSIYPTEAEAQAACTQHMPRELRVWEKSISRTVIAVRTAFPAEAIAARDVAELARAAA